MSQTVYLAHHGIKGQKWGIRRFQNKDGSLTAEGRKRHSKPISDVFFGSKKRKDKNVEDSKKTKKDKKKQEQELMDYDDVVVTSKKSSNPKKDSKPDNDMFDDLEVGMTPDMTPAQKAEVRKRRKEAQDYLDKAYEEIFKSFVDEDGNEYWDMDEEAMERHLDRILEIGDEFEDLVF